MADDKIPDNYQSDDEEIERDEMVPRTTAASTPSTVALLERSAPIPSHVQGSYLGELQPPHIMGTDGLSTRHHHHSYVDGSSMNHPPLPAHHHGLPMPEMIPSPHVTSRRPS